MMIEFGTCCKTLGCFNVSFGPLVEYGLLEACTKGGVFLKVPASEL